MRYTYPIRIGELWKDFVGQSPTFSRHLAEARIPEIWASLVGNRVAAYTTSLRVVRGTMYVHLSSSVARNEVLMRRRSLVEAVNEAVGAQVINRIIVK